MLQAPASIPYWLAAKGMLLTDNHRRIASLREKHRGQRAFVIGNGPSLNGMHLRPLKNEVTFGSNAFFLAHERVGFVPTYYVVEDRLVAQDYAAELNQLTGTTKIVAHDLRFCLRPDPRTVYTFFSRYSVPDTHSEFPGFSGNALRTVFWGGTVTYMCLQLAFYMGIREVYLIGVDLSYKVPEEVDGDSVVSLELDQNHFDPHYFGPGRRWHKPNIGRMVRAFRRAGEFYSSHGGEVRNATVGGKLEVLPRVAYNTLVTDGGARLDGFGVDQSRQS